MWQESCVTGSKVQKIDRVSFELQFDTRLGVIGAQEVEKS